ncbi:MAG: restriction endonuclease subunit S [Lewinellaceae bacterium]|nr:restriction endonuclease subunit S [Lewinellaceae bacterium]
MESIKIFRHLQKCIGQNNDAQPLLAVTQENGVIPRDMLEGRVTMPSGSTDSYKLVVPGNFVISLRSFQGGLEYSEYEGIVSPAYTVLKNKRPIDDTFFKFFFKSQEFISRLSVAVIGIRDGKQISFSDFSAMSFRYPPIEEQRAIGRILTEADREIELLHTKLKALQAQKKGLMQRLLTGRVRVKL